MIHGFRVKNLFALHFFQVADFSKNSKERMNT